jgi:putative ABC transport system ATP-binding protein
VRDDVVAASCAGIVQIYRSASGEVTALRGIDAQFSRGTLTVVMGPSGSGKSSLLRLLALHEQAAAGDLFIEGVATQTASARQLRRVRHRHIGVVLQRPTHNLFDQLTAAQHVEHMARRRGVAALVDVDRVLGEVGLEHRRGSRPRQLSGGEQQRLSVAVATVGAPSLVLADEPTAELDAANGEAVVGLLRRAAERGSAVVVNTHDPHVAAAADHLLVLRHGTLVSERTRGGATLAVIDSVGRLQLPPAALALFADHRAAVAVEDGQVVLRPAGRRADAG